MQVADQQLITTAHEKRQKDVVVVVTVEVPSELLAMHPVVGSNEVVVDRLFGRLAEREDELLDHLLVDRDRPVPFGLLLEATQGGLAGQHAIGVDDALQCDGMAQRMVGGRLDPRNPGPSRTRAAEPRFTYGAGSAEGHALRSAGERQAHLTIKLT